MTRDEFIHRRPIATEFEARGVKVVGSGVQRMARCPFHEDGSASLSINVELGVWKCHAGCGGGSVIDAIAMYEGCRPEDVLKRECSQNGQETAVAPLRRPVPQKAVATPLVNGNGHSSDVPKVKPVIDCLYSYRNAMGDEVYQAVRLKPKDFRQRHRVGEQWVWKMDGVERVLYRLPEVLAADEVWVVEGEKDVENLVKLGYCATTNVGGAEKWMDGYTESLRGKKVVICGDNDDPGRKHVQEVFDSIAGHAKEVKIVKVPSPHKDVSDFIASMGEASKAALDSLKEDAVSFVKGVKLPIYSMFELQDSYIKQVNALDSVGLNLSKWLPSLRKLRTVVPGDLVVIAGATGIGKTSFLSNLAIAAAPMPTLFFQLELPKEVLFERLMALRTKMGGLLIEKAYKTGEKHGEEFFQKAFPSFYISTEVRLSVEDIEQRITMAELKMGVRPRLVLVDYIGLIKGKGSSRYDRFSEIAEDLRLMAKATQTIVVLASQIGRKKDDDSPEVGAHDCKESGSIENSSSFLLGAWRDADNPELMVVKVLKANQGGAGLTVPCNYNSTTLQITEISRSVEDP